MTKATKTTSAAKTAKGAATGKKPAATPKAGVPAKVAATRKPRAAPSRRGTTVPEEQRRHYVEVAAYYIAERRGFAPGDPLADWAAAEAEIDRLLAEGRLNP